MEKRDLLAPFVGGYWFVGGYVFAWWTPSPLQAGWVGAIIGLVLFAWARHIERQGNPMPPLLSLVIFAPPLSLMLAGAIVWVLERFISPLLPN